jgi:hypothetical protein
VTRWTDSPRTSVERYARAVGDDALVAELLALLAGAPLDAELGEVLAGPASRSVIAGSEGGPTGYWVRVWALRAFLYTWNDVATPAVVSACADESWRCREMALKVTARRRLDEALEAATRCQGDPVARVRAAAQRALRVLVESGSAP